MRLYYLTSSEHALSNAISKRIKISLIDDLNDPFELLGVNLRDKRLRQVFRDTKQEIHKNNGVICFSETWQNPVMWSHYGDKHKGMCLGFDITDGLVMPVSYSDSLLKITDSSRLSESELAEEFSSQLLTLKFQDWAYEKERRLFIKLDHTTQDSGLYFQEFTDDLLLREIILGARCEEPISKVRGLASTFEHRVHVKKARIAFTKFAVVENRRYREK